MPSGFVINAWNGMVVSHIWIQYGTGAASNFSTTLMTQPPSSTVPLGFDH